MSTTLIVRDATLVINGAPEKRGEPGEHLARRLAAVAEMDPSMVEECAEVLLGASTGDQPDPEVLEAMIVIALALPTLAARFGLTPTTTGRRLAARLERLGQTERALALLEVLVQCLPGEKELERDLGALMRRQGMVRDLADRYLERAQSLIREGRTQEGVGWLREILQLDRGRRDVARMIRDLRFQEVSAAKNRQIRWKVVITTLLFSLGVSFVALRETRVLDKYRSLPPAVDENLGALRRRLTSVEGFMEEHPAWHRTFHLVKERSELRIAIEKLEEERRIAAERHDAAQRESIMSAEAARHRAMEKIAIDDLQGALEEFQRALEAGGPTWPGYEQVQRDAASVMDFIRKQEADETETREEQGSQ